MCSSFNAFSSVMSFFRLLFRLAPPTNVPKPTPKSTTTTQKPAVNSMKHNPTVNRVHPVSKNSRPNPAVGGTVIIAANTVSGIGLSPAVGQTAPKQPQPFGEQPQKQPQNHQDNVPSDDDTSLSEDSDIDER